MFLHTVPITFDVGNGCSSVFFAKYLLSMFAVVVFSLYVPFAWCLHPTTDMIPCSVSICFLDSLSNSFASNPVSAKIVNIVVYFSVVALMIFLTFSVVGISGMGG